MSQAATLLDTNVVSYLMKGGRFAAAYAPHARGRLLAVAFITVGELYFGAEKANWGEKKRRQLDEMLRNFVVIPYDHEIVRCYGRVVDERQKLGRQISSNDAWIAACAVRHEIPLVTHDARDFESITGLELVTEPILQNQETER